MGWRRSLTERLRNLNQGDDDFLDLLVELERLVAKFLAIVMIGVILVSLFDLVILVVRDVFTSPPVGFFNQGLIEIFGAFLSVLIALEIMENITAYLRKHVVQVELVIVTSLTAVARKIIILDLGKIGGNQIIGLAIAILALSLSYWTIRIINDQSHD